MSTQEQKTPRKQGFYWVIQIGDLWEVGYWSMSKNWTLTGQKEKLQDFNLRAIFEHRIEQPPPSLNSSKKENHE